MDNGPEFIANIMQQWSEMHEIEFKYIEPGKPMQNGYIERFNRTYREAVLDSYIFENLEEARAETEIFMKDYIKKLKLKEFNQINSKIII